MDTKDKAKSASYLDLHIDTDTINNVNVSIVSFLFIEFWTYIVKSQIKSSMKKLLDCDYNKHSIYLVICNTYIT
jgi:hypothetical protein